MVPKGPCIFILFCFLVSLPVFGSNHKDFDISEIDDVAKPRNVQYPHWFSDTFLDFREDLKAAHDQAKLGIIVYFGQKDCAYCEALLDVNFGREKDIVSYTRQHFNVIPIDIWGSREVTDFDGQTITESVFSEFEETHFTPSLNFYLADGNEVLRLRGYYPPYKFRAAMAYVVDGYYKKETLRDYMARADPPAKFDIGDMTTEEFFDGPPLALDRSYFPAGEPLAVFFEQTGCHACDILHSEPLHNSKTRALLRGFQTVQLNMWSDTPVLTPTGEKLTAQQWARKLGIFYAPTIVFFDESGREVLRVDSVVRLYRLRGLLEFVLHKGYQHAPTYQRWRENIQRAQQEVDISFPAGNIPTR